MTTARSEDGFTLVELLVSMTLGLIVLFAVTNLMTTSSSATKRITDRVDATQRGRIAMSQIIQPLRAMACLPASPSDVRYPIISATADEVTWYANLDRDARVDADGDGDPTFDLGQRRVTMATTASGRSLVSESWTLPVTAGVPQPVAAGVAPTARRTLHDGVTPTAPGAPTFKYWGFASGTATTPTQLPTPVPAAQLGQIVRIDVAFRSLPSANLGDGAKTPSEMRSSVYSRSVRRAAASTSIPTFECST